VDREGSVWVGDQTGLHRLSYSSLAQVELPNAPGPLCTVAAGDDGVAWVSAGNGDGLSTLYRVQNGRAEIAERQHGLTNFAYRAPDRTIWLGGEGGLWRMTDGRLTQLPLPPEMANSVQFLRTVTQDRAGAVWVSFGPPG